MKRLLLLLASLCLPIVLKAQTCDLSATTANFATQVAAATPGQTLCLATGDYGTWNGIQKSSPGVKITAAMGASPRMSFSPHQTSPQAQWLILDNLSLYGIQDWSAPANNITVQNSMITGKINIWAGGPNSACSNCGNMSMNTNILFNFDTFDFADGGEAGTFEGRFNLLGTNNTPANVIVENSTFNGQGAAPCADGAHVAGGGPGEQIINNVFENLQEDGCVVHVDSIQFEGAQCAGGGIVISGNYFHDSSTGIAAYDNANCGNINNNVFQNITQDALAVAGFNSTSIIEHNTVLGVISCGNTHQNNPCSAILRNNISTGYVDPLFGSAGGATPSFFDYNLCTSGSCTFSGNTAGPHSLIGTPTFVGGATPSTWAGFALTPTSLGHSAASDGMDIGINVPSTAPQPPTNLTATPGPGE